MVMLPFTSQAGTLGREDMAFAHVDHFVRAGLVEPDQRPPAAVDRAQRGSTPCAGGRKVHGRDTFRHQPLPLGRVEHPVAHEAGKRLLVEMLDLAPAAASEVAARRLGVVRSGLHGAVRMQSVARRGEGRVAARRGDAIAFRGDADDFFGFAHSAAA